MSDLISAGNTTQTRRPTASATEAGSRSKRFADPVIAYAILRLSFCVNIMLHGASRLLAGGSAFNAYLDRYFEHTPLMSKSFLHVLGAVLPAVEAILGLLLVLGIVTRVALIAGGLLMTALVFGTNLAVPGLGSFFVAGPIVAALAGVGPGGVTGLVGALLGLGLSEYEAKSYEDQIRRGGILMSVHCDRPDWAKRAKHVFHETGAEDIASGGEANADFIENDKPVLRHVARRRIRSLTALRASRKSGSVVRVNRFWNVRR